MARARERLSWGSECFSSFVLCHSGFKEAADSEEVAVVTLRSKSKTKRNLFKKLNLDPHLPFTPALRSLTISRSYSRLKGENAELGQLFLLWEIY